jgi:hypothetical protein
MLKRLSGAGTSWIRAAEHTILRVVSFGFSLASAYAIRLFFAPLDAVDRGEMVITWVVAAGFGVLGYVVSRGLVHRMMQKESVWAYAPICVLVELVDIACNYMLAASVVQHAWWLEAVPENQRGVAVVLTYVVLSAIPLVSIFLAVVDMDLERSKHGALPAAGVLGGKTAAAGAVRPAVPFVPARAGQSGNGNQGASLPMNGGNAAAAKRAQYWNGQQKQPGASGGQGGARNLLDDPEKDAVSVP